MNSIVERKNHASTMPVLWTVSLMSTLGSGAGFSVDDSPLSQIFRGYEFAGTTLSMAGIYTNRESVPTRQDFEVLAIGLAMEQIPMDHEIRALSTTSILEYLD